jgi:alpha,alpha-trehalose phosphorylase
VRVRSTRFVSFTHRSIVGIAYEVEPLDGPVHVVVQSELVANEPIPAPPKDPRVARAVESPLTSEESLIHGDEAVLVHRTKQSGLRLAVAMRHVVHGTPRAHTSLDSSDDSARYAVIDHLEPGQRLEVVKLVAYGWSRERTRSALHDQVLAALVAAFEEGWDSLLAEQRAYLDAFWARADVEVEGDSELQQAVRYALFQTLSAGARAEGRAIPAKGLTGSGYDGHSFWDSEIFVLPVLTFTAPDAAADQLRWRHETLGIARDRARALGLEGAAFPWRTIHGEECSGYWPAGTAAFHINGDIADATIRYVDATGDTGFERDAGLDLLVHTARLWRSLGHFDLQGQFRIDGVTGPDEYSALADNNVYTNLSARRNLEGAACACERYPDRAQEFGVSPDEMASWRAAADRVLIPYDAKRCVHPQAEGFTEHEAWNFAATEPDDYPLLLHFPYFDIYRKQVVKQPDLVLAMVAHSDAFTAEQKLRNFDYYERITVRDSSLAANTQAVMAAEVGHLSLALDYAAEAALMDLLDLENNLRDGLHIASLAGAWIAFVAGFGGMRAQGGKLSFRPRLPEGLTRISFAVTHRRRCLRVRVTADRARYTLDAPADARLAITHHGEPLDLEGRKPVERPIPPAPQLEPPSQPPGREPRRRTARR